MFNISKGTKTVILIMTVLVILGISIAKIYYGNVNASEDPRVIDAKHLYKKYNIYTENNDYNGVFLLLDSIKEIYIQFPDYKNSFEVGVVYNNIGATYLSLFLHEKKNDKATLDSAKKYCEKSSLIYNNWLKKFDNLTQKEVENIVNGYYNLNLDFFKEKSIDRIKNKRVEDILTAQVETLRRLSVAYTNLGIISRHNMFYDEAIKYYKKALELWEDNLTAKNNINILLGRELEERSTIDKLFPKEKND